MLRRTVQTMALAATIITPWQALSDPIRAASQVPVAEAVLRLTGAVEAAGATVFNVVNFTEGAASVGLDLRPTALVIFGSPKIGAGALLDSQTLGLTLPLEILAYEDAGGSVWLMHDDPAEAAAVHGVAPDHPAIKAMTAVLDKMTGIASGG